METEHKPFVFVLMPFSSDFENVYELGIRGACEEAGADCQRIDEQVFVESIVERIYSQIASAEVIVADVTGNNPNVFYEIGYAHALKKPVILLTQDVKDTPFDIKHYPHLIYEERKISALKTQLGQRIKRLLENSAGSDPQREAPLQLSINGVPAGERPTARMNTNGYVYFDIGIHNPTIHVITFDSYSLVMILPGRADFYSPGGVSGSRLSDGQYIYTLAQAHNILPFGWLALEVKFNLFLKTHDTAEATVRLFAGGSFEDYTVILKT